MLVFQYLYNLLIKNSKLIFKDSEVQLHESSNLRSIFLLFCRRKINLHSNW